MYHQIKIIGVLMLYKYLFTINVDTTVDLFSLNPLISAYVAYISLMPTNIHLLCCSMVHDKKVLSVCGGMMLSNAK